VVYLQYAFEHYSRIVRALDPYSFSSHKIKKGVIAITPFVAKASEAGEVLGTKIYHLTAFTDNQDHITGRRAKILGASMDRRDRVAIHQRVRDKGHLDPLQAGDVYASGVAIGS
jgi:hypothetical protein